MNSSKTTSTTHCNKEKNFDYIRTQLWDDYDHHPADQNMVEYIVENVLMTSPPGDNSVDYGSYKRLANLYNTFYCGHHCSCRHKTCKNLPSAECIHGGNYCASPQPTTELVLSPTRPCLDLIYECSTDCLCSPRMCHNRLVQYGPRKGLQIVAVHRMMSTNQRGLITLEFIPTGAFVCEYAGELLTREEAHRRHSVQDHNSMNYILCMNEHCFNVDDGQNRFFVSSSERQQTFIDPGRKGNIGRYFNHSCDPNCEIISVRVDGPVPKLGIFNNNVFFY